jgi:hypothetical protein
MSLAAMKVTGLHWTEHLSRGSACSSSGARRRYVGDPTARGVRILRGLAGVLLDHGANVNARQQDHYTPLHAAVVQ